MAASVLEQPVKVGDSRYIHARSAFNPSQTRCGLTNTLQTFFVNTDEEITCRHCRLPTRERQKVKSA